MALVQKTFSDLVTFTRASTGTYFDSTGVLRTAAVNAPRFDFDPVTRAGRGILVEAAATNLLTYSQDLSNSIWIKSNVTAAGGYSSPDGQNNATKITATATSAVHEIIQTVVSTMTTGDTFATAIMAKAAERSVLQMRWVGGAAGTSSNYVNFDLVNGVMAGNATPSKMTYLGNGWWMCSVTQVITGTAVANKDIGFGLCSSINDGRRPTTTGTGTDGLLLFAGQVEMNLASSYVPTTSTTATRAADNAQVANINTQNWYNPNEGTIVAEVSTDGPLTTTASDRRHLFSMFSGSDAFQQYLMAGGTASTTQQASGSVVTQSVLAPQAATAKAGASFDGTNLTRSINGSVNTVAAALTVSALGTLAIGLQSDLTRPIQGHIKAIRYYPRKFTESELQALTT